MGDVQPYVALGIGLKGAGHDVRLATHEKFRDLVQRRGLNFFSVAGDPQTLLEGETGKRWLESGKNPLAFMKRMMETVHPIIWQLMSDCWKASQDTDLILCHTLAVPSAACITEKLNIPDCPAYLHHVHQTRSYPSPVTVPLPTLGSLYNKLTYPLGEWILWRMMRPVVNRWRGEILDLPSLPKKSPFKEWVQQNKTCLYGFSPNVIPRAPEWGDEVHITGYWFLKGPVDWGPPADLVDFLESGSPPVFIGFGSMVDRNPEEVTEMVIKALAMTKQRGVLHTGWGNLGRANLPDDIFKIDSIPFDWLFPKMSVVVHHGGAGTTATGLQAGVPSIIVPFFADQHFWAWRVRKLGVGPKAVSRKKMSPERLAAVIKETLGDKEMKRRAAALGQAIRSEDGVGQAVKDIHDHFLTK
jgi:UDP:flavonoid glycosyltransferase YjiC (YdhE family)